MVDLIAVAYVGKKPFAFDNVAGSGKCWKGAGDVQEVTLPQARVLVRYPDQWGLVNEDDYARVLEPAVMQHIDERGRMIGMTDQDLRKPLEKMSKVELLVYAQHHFGKELAQGLSKKAMIDQIEEWKNELDVIVE